MAAAADVVLIDGEPGDESISVFDGGVLRGDGCFEALRSYRGHPFAFEEHYRRLSKSAAALRIPVPKPGLLYEWVVRVAAAGGDGIIRVVLTRGGSVTGRASPSRCIVIWHALPEVRGDLSLLPVPAPWHPAGRRWELSGVKTISYAPNQAATRLAQEAAFDDALLVSDAGAVLEGPTFSVAWVIDGVVETASLELGLLDSITRRFVLADCATHGIDVREGWFDISRLEGASEVFAMSTVKQVAAVGRVGEWTYPAGEMTALLDQALSDRTQVTAPHLTTGR
ncbi:MAG: aminotransferase class IV [Acidimicrobiia bacterium]